MRSVGLVLLALSLLLGGVSVWGLKHLSSARAEPAPRMAPAAKTSVVVAARPIAFGEAITPADLKVQPWPDGAAPPGAFRSVAELTSGAKRFALAPIAPNEPVLSQRVTGPGGRATLANIIRPGMRASTIRVDDVMGVAGFVLPGDFVDVLVTRNDGEERRDMRTDVLLQSVRVLAVDQLDDQDKNKPVLAKAATIEVTPAQAEKLALASQVGALSLALRSGEDPLTRAEPSQVRTIRTADLTSGPAPTARPHRRMRLARAAPAGPTIQIYRGAQASSVSVAQD